jgi:hypothetical protein
MCWREDTAVKTRPWNSAAGAAAGSILGAVLWWSSFDPSQGHFQQLHLVIVPAALGVLIVSMRNRRKKVGVYDPEIIARNKKGRV